MTNHSASDPAALDTVSVCVCTYKRPAPLLRLLHALENQQTDGCFAYSIVVVDNDREGSARAVVERFAAGSALAVAYEIQPEQNISLTRNRAVALTDGGLVAMVDDDEFPRANWLLEMYRTLQTHGADGVLGPVLPHFAVTPPGWVLKGRFCERRSFATGTVLRDPLHTRTGNVMIRRTSLLAESGPFDPRYGRTGGEDVDFFRRRLAGGDRFVWCDEAPVFENVPPERLTRGYFLRRALMRGVANADRVSVFSGEMVKSTVAVLAYSTVVLPLLLVRHDLFMHTLIRDCDHLGKVLAVLGIRLVHQRGQD